ncbi:MAG: hypothetical protein ABW189_03740 [Rickettsiales bacterium]
MSAFYLFLSLIAFAYAPLAYGGETHVDPFIEKITPQDDSGNRYVIEEIRESSGRAERIYFTLSSREDVGWRNFVYAAPLSTARSVCDKASEGDFVYLSHSYSAIMVDQRDDLSATHIEILELACENFRLVPRFVSLMFNPTIVLRDRLATFILGIFNE